MQIFSIYLLIGLVLTIAASELNKIPSYDSDDIIITNSDRGRLHTPLANNYTLCHL